MSCGSTSNAGSQLQAQNQAQQQLTNQSVQQINNAFSGFNPQFYQNAQNAYTNWALPQLGQQQRDTQKQMGFSLANSGLTNSGAANTERNALSAQTAQAQQSIANNAVQTSNTLKQQIGQEQANLIGQAQSATSPSTIGQQATAAASGFTAPSSFAPLGQLFNQFGSMYLAGQNANTYNNFSNQYLNAFSNPAIYGQNLYGFGSNLN